MNLRSIILGGSPSAVAALVGDRVYPDILPQKPVVPALVYTRVSGESFISNSGTSNLENPLYQVDCWADTVAARTALYEAVRDVLSGYTDAEVQGIFLVRSRDSYDYDAKLYRRSVDFQLWNKESA